MRTPRRVLDQGRRGSRVCDGMEVVDLLAVVEDQCRGDGERCELLIGCSERRLLAIRLEVFSCSFHGYEEVRDVLSQEFLTSFGAVAFDVGGPDRCFRDLLHGGEAVVVHVFQVVLLGELLCRERAAGEWSDHEGGDIVGSFRV